MMRRMDALGLEFVDWETEASFGVAVKIIYVHNYWNETIGLGFDADCAKYSLRSVWVRRLLLRENSDALRDALLYSHPSYQRQEEAY